MMINILIEGMTNNTGGKETYIVNMYKALDKTKYTFTFIAYDDVIAYEDFLKETGAKIIHIPPRNDGVYAHIKALKKLFKSNKFDVVWSHKTTLSACELIILSKKYNVPIRMMHSHSSANMGGKFTFMMHMLNKQLVFRWANRYLACSEVAARWFYGKHKAVIMKNGIDLAKFKYDENIRKSIRKKYNLENRFVIGHVGRFGIEKNHKKLISVVNEYRKFDDNVCLLLCGDGEERENIENQIKYLKMENNIMLLGVVSNVNEFLQAMDIIVMPSLFEGLPFALLEAQTAGLKCIVSDTVSSESNILKWNKFIPLDADDKIWAECIHKENMNYDRNIGYVTMKENKFDLEDCVVEFDELISGGN